MVTLMTAVRRAAMGLGALGVAAGLAGCGGGTTSASGANVSQSYNETRTGYQTMLTDVFGDTSTGATGLSHTSIANMPTAGKADFNGYAVVIAGDRSKPHGQFIVFGNSTMEADFGTGALTGSATNFKGGPENPDTGILVSAPRTYSGTVSLTAGCIGPTACGNSALQTYQAAATATGTLTGDGHTVTVNEPLTGQVYGNSTVKALEVDVTRAAHLGTTTLDGAATDGGVGFVGEKP